MERKRRDKKVWFLVLGVFVAVFLFSFLVQKFKKVDEEVEAASLANFDPGYIISDYQMTNYKSMNESQIQTFLRSKNSCNDTNMSKASKTVSYYSEAYPPYTWHVTGGKYVCLANEKIKNETAAHIIYQTAQDYRINPQVLLVLLQKEQGFVTDTFPNSFQYRSATGYGCPDTAACSTKYYGFKNQVRNAASMFRTVMDGGWTNYPVGKNYIQYNPNADCGGSWVNIKNKATSALYRYTPYQPNKGALAAGYGTASCGAYGNRNFYLYFQDWFGGITSSTIQWEEMKTPRVMTVGNETLVIDASKNTTTNNWLKVGENYYFTKKLSLFWGNEQQTCLQRKIDEGTNNCVLMSRMNDFSLENGVDKLTNVKDYEVTNWTCMVELSSQEAECNNNQQLPEGKVVKIDRTTMIDNKEYLIEKGRSDGLGVLKVRTKVKLYYETIGPVVMKLVSDSYKNDSELDNQVQILNTETNTFIKMMDKVKIDGKVYYRTKVDHDRGNDYIISSSVLSEKIFSDFLIPRKLKTRINTYSINLNTGTKCKNYSKGYVQKYSKKIEYDGIVYAQGDNENKTNCVVKYSDLMEVN